MAVSLFLKERIGFMQMSRLIEESMQRASFVKEPSLDDYLQSDREVREMINSQLSAY
jgi:1-deoxy-D-xylulose-5-phosphate reductoisomerase